MSYRIPDEDILSNAIKKAMLSAGHVDSQKKLTEIVCKELHKIDPALRAGAERIRRTAIEKNLVRIEINYRETENIELPEICPVCKNAMNSVMNMTLDGEKTEVKRKCTVCSYNFGHVLMMPGRYRFTRIGKAEISENEKRIRKLEKARSKLREASVLIEGALCMTGLESRGEYAKKTLAQVSGSREQAGSVINLISDIRSMDETDPGWLSPTTSIKNINRKDI